MARKKSQEQEDIELNMTPMIDVVFNLIIFFMIVTDMTQKELEQLTLPKSSEAVEDTGDETERRVIINIVKKNPETFDQDKEVEIYIKKVLYDLDHPGHYRRRIKADRSLHPHMRHPVITKKKFWPIYGCNY